MRRSLLRRCGGRSLPNGVVWKLRNEPNLPVSAGVPHPRISAADFPTVRKAIPRRRGGRNFDVPASEESSHGPRANYLWPRRPTPPDIANRWRDALTKCRPESQLEAKPRPARLRAAKPAALNEYEPGS